MIYDVIEETKEKISKENLWFPFPSFISLYLAFILIKFLSYDFYCKDPHKKELPLIEAKSAQNTDLWLSISQTKNTIIITTDEKNQFFYKTNNPKKINLSKFSEYLSERVKKHAFSVILSKNIDWSHLNVVLSVDKNIVLSHVFPVIKILAETGITHYGFETKIPVKNKA